MESETAVEMLSALAHEGRLSIFRRLVRSGPDGEAAGDIGRNLDIGASTLSAHLAILSRAGLIAARRQGRSIIYAARYEAMTRLLGFLVQDCCQGAPEICSPLQQLAATAACGPAPGERPC